jgi:hypothetical protein
MSASTISASRALQQFNQAGGQGGHVLPCPYECFPPGADAARPEAKYPYRARHNGGEKGRETMFLDD